MIAQHLVVIINNFSHKMSSLYDRNANDKENALEYSYYPSKSTKQSSVSNDQLRRKIDQNLALMQKNHSNMVLQSDHQHYKPGDYSNIKRDNARKRGFDMKVHNIDSINDKITGLLSMVRKDKQKQIIDAQPVVRERVQGCKTPSLIDRIKKMSANKGGQYTPKVNKQISSFIDNSNQDRKRGNYNIQEPISSKRNDFEHIQRRLKIKSRLQEEQSSLNPLMSFNRCRNQKQIASRSSWWNHAANQQSTIKDIKSHSFIEDHKIQDQMAQQKKNFDDMLEERRKQRILNRQTIRQKSQTRIGNTSALKSKYSYQEYDESRSHNRRDSPIVKVSQQNFRHKYELDEPFNRIKTPSPKPKRESPKARDREQFTQVQYIETGGQKHAKINTTARIIDEQLLRIKSKINESETNQKRLESYRPKNNPEPSKTKQHIIRMAESISAQVQFDTRLKPARQAFQKIASQQKWTELQQKLSIKGLRLDRGTLKELMKIGPDQHNPFGGAQKDIGIQEIAELISHAEKNWENYALKCASARALKNQSFQVSDLDLHNKGYLSLQDLVCFVNLYTNTFYRNRDMALIMRRLQLSESPRGVAGVDYQTFLNAFSA